MLKVELEVVDELWLEELVEEMRTWRVKGGLGCVVARKGE